MSYLQGVRKDGSGWTVKFVSSLDEKKCIGCGRCFKACAHSVFEPFEDEEADDPRVVMTLANEGNCIGCTSCAVACPKGCLTHEPLAV